MINMHIDYSGDKLDFATACRMALMQARSLNMKQPVVVSWHSEADHRFSPGFESADEASWWAKYGEGNGGQAGISVGEDYQFIVMESGGFETVRDLPLRNLKDAAGAEYVCLSPMLDDTGQPRRDACTALDDWTADQA